MVGTAWERQFNSSKNSNSAVRTPATSGERATSNADNSATRSYVYRYGLFIKIQPKNPSISMQNSKQVIIELSHLELKI
jgi:hypothetical protein